MYALRPSVQGQCIACCWYHRENDTVNT